MAQSTFMSSLGGNHHLLESRRSEPSLQSQIRRLRPVPFSRLVLSPATSRQTNLPSSYASPYAPTLALFKSKAKAAPKKEVIEKQKSKVEDGIFGTSGGIGFTKENELFVGRVAMIGFDSWVPMAMVSAIHYKEKFYCLFLGQGLMVVDVDSPIEDGITGHYFEMDQSQLDKIDTGEDRFGEDKLEFFLVESNGKMLLVLQFFEYDPSCTTLTLERFELFEADFLNRRWVKMESLGDQSMFIYRKFVVSLLAADVGVKENCIYTINPPADEPTPWSVFDFGTGMVMADVSLPCPPLSSTHLMFVPSIY